ncbi:MAG: histidine phosphatase family protein [Acidimicrobiia bacterium]
MPPVRLYLLRHGQVPSHRGDLSITPEAVQEAFVVGEGFGQRERGIVEVISGETRRAKETASHLAQGIVAADGQVIGPAVALALRNPDLYVAGTRVNMVSSPEALAAQVDGLSAQDVARLAFFREFLAAPDRIGMWLTHGSPPGEDARSVATRVRSFAASMVDSIPGRPEVVVAVTHSPLLRAVALDFLGRDIGEPPWVTGLVLSVAEDRTMSLARFGIENG